MQTKTVIDSDSILKHAPRLFSLPAPFLSHLADYVICLSKQTLSRCTVFLPYERAIPFLQKELVDRLGPCLLPMIRTLDCPLGYDVSIHQTGPSIPAFEFQGWLFHYLRRKKSVAQALELSCELFDLFTQIGLHNGQWEKVWTIVPEHLTHHFQVTISFLKSLCQESYVKKYCAGLQNHTLQIEQWQKHIPTEWVIAAGSTASLPSTQALLQAIQNLPKGMVVFSMPCLSPPSIPEDAFHPLFTLGQFLKRNHRNISDILPLKTPSQSSEKRGFFFLSTYAPIPYTFKQPPSDTYFTSCATLDEEALTVAYLLKNAPDTALLITPDRTLTDRVFYHLRRLGIDLPQPTDTLSYLQHPWCTFSLLILDLVRHHYATEALFAVLQHPLYVKTYPMSPRILSLAKRWALRRLPFADIRKLLSQSAVSVPALLKKLWTSFYLCLQPLEILFEKKHSLKKWIQCHKQCLTNLLPNQEPKKIQQSFEEWLSYQHFYKDLTQEDYRLLLHTFFSQHTLSLDPDLQSRISIKGPLDARLMYADRIILSGLNEGTWPTHQKHNPFLNRLMKDSLSLPPDLWSFGLSARDFLSGLCGREVFLTRSIKYNGAVTIPSRFFVRLTMSTNIDSRSAHLPSRTLQGYPAPFCPQSMPCPYTPYRPRYLSATDISWLQRDPYEFYIKKILSLRPLPSFTGSMDKRHFGLLLHRLLEDFMKKMPPFLGQTYEELESAMADCTAMRDDIVFEHALWKYRLLGVLTSFLKQEWQWRQQESYRCYTERKGRSFLKCPDIVLSAVADRIDVFQSGKLRIIDYKTGSLPSKKEIEQGKSPQMLIEAFLAMQGSFLPDHGTVDSLILWKLSQTDEKMYIYQDIKDWVDRGIVQLLEKIQFIYEEGIYRPSAEPREKEIALISRQKEWA